MARAVAVRQCWRSLLRCLRRAPKHTRTDGWYAMARHAEGQWTLTLRVLVELFVILACGKPWAIGGRHPQLASPPNERERRKGVNMAWQQCGRETAWCQASGGVVAKGVKERSEENVGDDNGASIMGI